MRNILRYLENSVTWWKVVINAVVYGIGFYIYQKCMVAIQTTEINMDNVLMIMFDHPGESTGAFFSGLFLNIFSVWMVLVAIVSVLFIVTNTYDNQELIITILNVLSAIASVVVNIMFVKVYWAVFLVLVVFGIVIYSIGNSD